MCFLYSRAVWGFFVDLGFFLSLRNLRYAFFKKLVRKGQKSPETFFKA